MRWCVSTANWFRERATMLRYTYIAYPVKLKLRYFHVFKQVGLCMLNRHYVLRGSNHRISVY
jgi:hypothetical protein